jgi:hypothetical protein
VIAALLIAVIGLMAALIGIGVGVYRVVREGGLR